MGTVLVFCEARDGDPAHGVAARADRGAASWPQHHGGKSSRW